MVSGLHGTSARSQLSFEGVTKTFLGQTVLEDVSFSVAPGEKVAIIGENGSGKSTLLRIVAGVEEPGNGVVTVTAAGGRVYLPQRFEPTPGARVRDIVDEAFADLNALQRQLREAEETLGSATPEELEQYGDRLAEFEMRGGYEVPARVEAALDALGLPGLDQDRPLDTLSGGEGSRLALAAALAADPELLLLDEPTNDLDAAALDWLEGRLRGHRGTVVVVTHDRAFLERVTTVLLEVDGDRHRVQRHGNGYAGYLAAKAAARAAWVREYADWEAEVRRQERLSENAGRMLASISSKGPAHFSGAGQHRSRSSSTATSGKVRNANERLRRLIAEPVRVPPEPLRFAVPNEPAAADPSVGGHDPANIAELADTRVDGRLAVDWLRVAKGDRLLVTGPNGAGKSTLLKLLAGDLQPDHGSVRTARRVGYLRQDGEQRDPHRTVLEAFSAGRPGLPEEYERDLLAMGLFWPEDLDTPVSRLSAGQRRRLDLARVVAHPSDLLLLDEPTNHLSPVLVEELQEALHNFPGAVIVVTHDRRLRENLGGNEVVVEGGVLRPAS